MTKIDISLDRTCMNVVIVHMEKWTHNDPKSGKCDVSAFPKLILKP